MTLDRSDDRSDDRTDDRVASLIEAWLDGAVDDAGFAELEGAILASAETRRAFWQRAALHGLLREAVTITAANPPVTSRPPPAARGVSPSRMTAAILALLFGGSCLGSLATSLAFAYSGRGAPTAALVVVHEEGFERPPAPEPHDIPRVVDVWGGDETEVVEAEQGVAPRSGRHMLRFVSGQPRGATYTGRGSEIWRIIDLEPLRADLGSSELRVVFSAFCNGLGEAARPPRFWLSAIATAARPDELGNRWADQFLAAEANPGSIAASQTRDLVDADAATWERLATTVTVPARARFLLLHCAAGMGDEPPGERRQRCYVDDITVAVQPVDPPPDVVPPHAEGRQ